MIRQADGVQLMTPTFVPGRQTLAKTSLLRLA